MLDKSDIKQIEQIVHGTEKRLEKRLSKKIETEIAASEKRLQTEIANAKQQLKAEIKQVSTDIGDILTEEVLPQIAEKADKNDVARLERKVDNFNSTNLDSKARIRKIESHLRLSSD